MRQCPGAAGHNPAMCTCSPESRLNTGPHQKQCGQQVQGGDSALLSGETPLGELHPALGSPTSGRCGHVEVSPGEGHEDAHSAHLL